MNSRGRSNASKNCNVIPDNPQKHAAKDDLAKIECLHHLFAETTGNDPYLLRSLKDAIEATAAERGAGTLDISDFVDAALRLRDEPPDGDSACGILHIDLRTRGFDPLFVQGELVAGLKRIAGHGRALVIVTGLRRWVLEGRRNMTARQRKRYDDAIAYIDDLAARWNTPSTELNLIYL